MTTGIEVKIVGMVLKTLFLPLIVLYFSPIYDWATLQIVTDYSLLSPLQKALLNDAKLIGAVLLVVLTVIKLVMGSYKIKKEIENLEEKKP